LARSFALISGARERHRVSRHNATEITDLQPDRCEHRSEQNGGQRCICGEAASEDGHCGEADGRDKDENLESHPEYGTE
jgi:hypothetical protein